MEKLQGQVKSWEDTQGYGFIEAPSMDDVFVHFSGIVNQRERTLEVGEPVSFMVAPGVRGPQAVLVEPEH